MNVVTPLMTERLLGRYLSKVTVVPSGCVIWNGGRNYKGYGIFAITELQTFRAHRVAYELAVGELLPGMTIDHLCRNRACVNPAHLEQVSNRTNIMRGESPTAKNARKTHCVNGHEFTPENTHLRVSGARSCRTCQRQYERASRERKFAVTEVSA